MQKIVNNLCCFSKIIRIFTYSLKKKLAYSKYFSYLCTPKLFGKLNNSLKTNKL
jgi:hypothetical protein